MPPAVGAAGCWTLRVRRAGFTASLLGALRTRVFDRIWSNDRAACWTSVRCRRTGPSAGEALQCLAFLAVPLASGGQDGTWHLPPPSPLGGGTVCAVRVGPFGRDQRDIA